MAPEGPTVALELQGHGRTRDIDRTFGYEAFADDIAGVAEHLCPDRLVDVGHERPGGVGAAARSSSRLHRRNTSVRRPVKSSQR